MQESIGSQASSVWQRALDVIDVKQLTTQVVAYAPKLLAAVAVFLIFVVVTRVTCKILRRVMNAARVEPALIGLLVDRLYRYAMLLVGLVMAADQLGINVAAAVAGLGIAGIAIGFAAQDSVANVISGIIIFWDKPFVVGDWVNVGDQYGSVSAITLRSTRIRTPQNTFVVLPNKMIIDLVLENLSKHGKIRVDSPVGIAYKEDIDAARRTLLEAVPGIEGILEKPAPDVVVTGLGDSSVNLAVRVWIDDPKDRQRVGVEVIEASKKALDRADIEIPFPHLQLFVDDVKDRVWEGARSVAR